jgi:hypothetical protein
MGIAQGYGRAAGSNALVFGYDAGDTRNSYIGEPTTNLINPASLGIYSWWTRAVQTLETLPNETYYGMPIYRLSLSLDTDEQRDYARSSGGAGTAWYAQYLTYQANTAYIASAIYRPVSHSDMTVKGHPSNIGGWGLTYNDSVELRNGWKRHRIDRNYGAVASDNKYYHLWAPSANTGDVLVIDITANQIEQKNHLTPFVNGTRSDTQGLLDLRGNSSINLSGVSFDNSAQFVFDGVNDSLVVTNNQLLKNNTSSIEFIIKYLNTPNGDIIQFGVGSGSYAQYYYRAYSGYSYWNWYPIGTGYGEIAIPNAALPLNQWHHIVMTGDSTGTVQFYINGAAQGGATRTANSQPATWTPADLTVGGFSWDGYSNSSIPVLKIYNRVLTQAEISNNYQHYKTRFNI